MEREQWKLIEGDYMYNYYVSTLGRVVTIKENSGYLNSINNYVDVYKRVGLRLKSGMYKSISLHRLVITTFTPNIYNKPMINHIDHNPGNNKLSNLEWCTGSENSIASANHAKSLCY